jgi:antitoxin component of MazEF toxin-antitoxin module
LAFGVEDERDYFIEFHSTSYLVNELSEQIEYARITTLLKRVFKKGAHMTIVVKKSNQDAIFMPADLMAALHLSDGDQVTATVVGENLRLARVSKFLELRGALADDTTFDSAMDWIDKAWQSWTPPHSA